MLNLIRVGVLRAICFSLLFAGCLPVAMAQETGRKLALVVGNSKYVSAGILPNGVRDAAGFHAFLTTNGFQSTLVLDGDRRTLAEALSKFSRDIQPQDSALFYFAGHGMQMQGENYLLGVEAKLASEFDVPGETLAVSELIASIERRARIALIFIDACRNNPLADRLNAEIEGKSRAAATRGLAPIRASGAGTMVAFAAAPGQLAYDGTGQNSPFTKALIDNLAQPGLEVGTAFKRVIRQVRLETQDRQSPQILSSLALEFYFGDESAAPQGGGDFLAEIDYGKAERIATARGWKQFLNKYPAGEHAQLARQALVEIEGDKPAVRLSPADAEKKLNLSQQQRKEIQLALAQLGYDIGNADGGFGKQTRREIARYQKALGLPETGFLTEITAARLNIPVATGEDEIYSAEEARKYNVDDLVGLETDERVIKAVKCLASREIMYGVYDGHLYVIVYNGGMIGWDQANNIAKQCNAHLATITTRGENVFIASLAHTDYRLFHIAYADGQTHKMGPWIGLYQDPGGREPRGGWRWVTDESLGFSAWHKDKPNEHKRGDDFGMYYTSAKGTVDMKDVQMTTWDDMGPSDSAYSFVLEFE
jgi:hypothetical protein